MSSFEPVDLRAHTLGDLRQALEVQPHPQQLHLAQHRHQRQLDLAHQPLEAALCDLLTLPVGQRAQQHRLSGRSGSSMSLARPRSSHSSANG